ncbi:MAG: hypothetical protein MJD61_06290 [Proteobacteria bacterium]|nr:hypothetical protein [Pseudomonadota bacterium]
MSPDRPQIRPRVRLTGFEGGPLILYGDLTCGLLTVQAAGSDCGIKERVSDVAVVGPKEAYAVTDNTVYRFDGVAWQKLDVLDKPGRVQARAIWANSELIAVAANDQQIYFKPAAASRFELQPGVPAGDYLALWGRNASDIWAGTSGGQIAHYSQGKWKTEGWIDPPLTDCQMEYKRDVLGMWGTRDVVYAYSERRVLRLSGGEQEVASFCRRGTRIADVKGRGSEEVFIAIVDNAKETACGNFFIVWYDGMTLRQF